MGRFPMRATACFLLALGLAGAAPGVRPDAAGAGAAGAVDRVKIRADLLELMGDGDATRQQVGEVLTLLEQKRQLVVVALAGKRARVQALQQALEDIQDEAEKAIRVDDAMAALNKALASQQQQLALAEKSGASPLEIAARLTDVSREASLISERREMIRSRIRGGTLLELMRCKVDADADVKELEAQLTSVDAQMAKLRQAQSVAAQP